MIEAVYDPQALYARYHHQTRHTYPHRLRPGQPWRQATPANLARGLVILGRLLWDVGLRGDYRRAFWHTAGRHLRHGNLETVFQVTMVAHHLIRYARDCLDGKRQASNYSKRVAEPVPLLTTGESADG